MIYLHELNNLVWEKTVKKVKFSHPIKKLTYKHTKIPLSPHEVGSNKNGYKKIKGCMGLAVVKLINPSDAKCWGRKIPSPRVTIRMKTLGGCI
jgi:hypothetical protein